MNLPAIANTLEEKIQDVQVVIDNREKRLFKTGVVESLPKINDVIRQILPLYGIDASPEHLIELTKFISTYKLIAVEEIKLAFEKFARQELNIDEHKLYGKVDLAAIGRILTAYINWRQKVYYTIDSEDEKKRLKMEEEQRQIEAKKKFYQEFPEMLTGFKGESYKDVPVYWYDAAMEAGLIQYAEGEKKAIWEEAQDIAKKQKIQADSFIDFKTQLHRVEEEGKKKAIIIAQKLAVWRIVLNKK
jgi:hypothetical protein